MTSGKTFGAALGFWLMASAASFAQSVVTLDSFNLDDEPKVQNKPLVAPDAPVNCLTNPDHASCKNTQRSSRSFSLSDVVNLGIVDRSEVEQDDDVVKVEDRVEPLPSIDLEILFDYNSANLRPDQLAPLYAVAKDLKEIDFSRARLVLMGHTDGVGSAAYNKDLSLKRANSVAAFLSQTANIPLYRINTSGMGFDFLRFPADPAHPANRRVQILLVE